MLSEGTLLAYLVEHSSSSISEAATLAEIKQLLDLDAHEQGRFAFVARTMPADDVAELF